LTWKCLYLIPTQLDGDKCPLSEIARYKTVDLYLDSDDEHCGDCPYRLRLASGSQYVAED